MADDCGGGVATEDRREYRPASSSAAKSGEENVVAALLWRYVSIG